MPNILLDCAHVDKVFIYETYYELAIVFKEPKEPILPIL